MKSSFRLWLVLLLALALPLRGALAAAQHCAGAAGAAHVHTVAGEVGAMAGHGAAAMDPVMDEASHAHAGHGGHAGGGHGASTHETDHDTVDGTAHAQAQAHADPAPQSQAHPASGTACSDCASCCAAPALVSSTILVPHAPPVAAVFPEPAHPAPQFVPSGDERPPRSA